MKKSYFFKKSKNREVRGYFHNFVRRTEDNKDTNELFLGTSGLLTNHQGKYCSLSDCNPNFGCTQGDALG